VIALLDTNAFLRWVEGDDKLSAKARSCIANPDNEILVSVVVAWELAMTSPPSKPCPCIIATPSTACWSRRRRTASCPWSVPTGRFPTTASNASGNRHATN
jgi:hypothetical protein